MPNYIFFAKLLIRLLLLRRNKSYFYTGCLVLIQNIILETKFDAILFDVDSKDTTIGMSCPPKEFVSEAILQKIVKMLAKNGLFVLNLVLRDESLKPEVLQKLNKLFKLTVAYKLEEDLNEVITCVTDEMDKEDFYNNYKHAFNNLNSFFVKNKLDKIESIIDKLKINE